MVRVFNLVHHSVDVLDFLLDPVVELTAECLFILRHECKGTVQCRDIDHPRVKS